MVRLAQVLALEVGRSVMSGGSTDLALSHLCAKQPENICQSEVFEHSSRKWNRWKMFSFLLQEFETNTVLIMVSLLTPVSVCKNVQLIQIFLLLLILTKNNMH